MPEPTFNQYAAPLAEVADIAPEAGYAELKFLSHEGRVGRLRYLAYTIGGGFLINLAFGVLAAILIRIAPSLGAIVALAAWLPILWFMIITGIKRAHDFGGNGWLSLVTFIPVIGFLLWVLIPGSKSTNSYGPPPPANTWGVRIVALIMPIAIIGVLAAVAIPAYKDYTDRARAAHSAKPH